VVIYIYGVPSFAIIELICFGMLIWQDWRPAARREVPCFSSAYADLVLKAWWCLREIPCFSSAYADLVLKAWWCF